MQRRLKIFLADERGGVMAEHALLIGFLAVALLVTLSALGETLTGFFTFLGQKLHGLSGSPLPGPQ